MSCNCISKTLRGYRWRANIKVVVIVISILLKLHYDKHQFIASRTRLKSFLRWLKNFGMVSGKLYPNTLQSAAELADGCKSVEGVKPNLIICSLRPGLLGLLIFRQTFLMRHKVFKINLRYSKFHETIVKRFFLCFRYWWVFFRSPVWQQCNMLQYRWILHMHL